MANNPDPIQQKIEVTADTSGATQTQRALDGVKDATREAGQATEQTGRAELTREQRLRQLRGQLEETVRAQDRYERQIEQGTEATEADRRAAERREQRIRRLGRVLADEERTQRRVNQAIRESGREADEASVGLGNLTKGFAALAGGVTAFGLLREAVQLYRQELENAAEAQRAAFETQVTIASAERSLKLNLPGADDAQVQRALDAARQIAEDNSVPIAQATQALASALSARGGNLDEAIEVTNLAAQIRPDQPEAIAKIAGAIGDVGDAAGLDDPTAALGFLLTVGGQSRVADFNQQATNIPAAIAGIVGQDFSPSDAGALFAALSVGAKDLTGDSTRTASIQLAEQINTFFKSQGRPERGSDAIAALQQDDALREGFFGGVKADEFAPGGPREGFAGLSLETRFRAPAASLLSDPGSSIAQQFSRNVGGFGDPAALAGTGQEKLRQLATGELETNAQINRVLKSATDQLEADNTALGRLGGVRDDLVPLLQASGNSALATRLDSLVFDVTTYNTPEAAVDEVLGLLEQQAQDIRSRAIGEDSGGASGEPDTVRRPLNEQERGSIETINLAIRKINEASGRRTRQQFIEQSAIPFGSTRGYQEDVEYRELRRNELTGTGRFERDDPAVRQPEADPRNFSDAPSYLDEIIRTIRDTIVAGGVQGPTQPIGGVIVNNGTIIRNSGDPLIDDLDGRDR